MFLGIQYIIQGRQLCLMTVFQCRGSKMPSIHNVLKLQKEGCAEMCSAVWGVYSKWWQTCRVDCTDLHILAHLVTVKVCVSEWVNCLSVPGTPQTLCRGAALGKELGMSPPWHGVVPSWAGPSRLSELPPPNCHLSFLRARQLLPL